MIATDIRTSITQGITNALTSYIDDQKLNGAAVEVKYFGHDDPCIMLLWPDNDMTKGILISYGQLGELYIEIYAAIDIGLQRKWNKEHIQTIPSIERGDNKDWLPYLMVTIKSAQTLVGAWKESNLVWTAPILTDCGSIDIRVGSIPTVASPRIPRLAYQMSPFMLLLGLLICFLITMWAGYTPSTNLRAALFIIAAVAESGILLYHISGRTLKKARSKQ